MEMEGKLYRASIDWGPPLRLSWSDGEVWGRKQQWTAARCGLGAPKTCAERTLDRAPRALDSF